MGLLDQLMGGAAGGNDRRGDYQDYADRYDSGQPHEGYDDHEVSRRYAEVSGEVDEDTYRDSARQSFERMEPDQRRQFGRQLHEHARGQGHDTGHDGQDEQGYEDPRRLADMTTRVHQQSPGLLGELLGSGATTGAGGGALAGLLGGGGGQAGGNPLAKAAMAGIAAYAAKQVMNRR